MSDAVNLIKLTSLEKKILRALLQPRKEDEYTKYPEGNDVQGLAELVYGPQVLNCEKPGGHYCSNLSICLSAKSSLLCALNSLWKKGLVKKGKPCYRYRWHKPNEFQLRGGGKLLWTKIEEHEIVMSGEGFFKFS